MLFRSVSQSRYGDLDYFDPIEEDRKLDDLKSKWLTSSWATKVPVQLEVPFETVLAGV